MGMGLITTPIATGHIITARRFTSITATGIMSMVGIINEGRFSFVDYKDAKGELRPEIILNKSQSLFVASRFDASMVLVTGYDAKKRSAVINRWMALEQGVASPQEALSTEGRGHFGFLVFYGGSVNCMRFEGIREFLCRLHLSKRGGKSTFLVIKV